MKSEYVKVSLAERIYGRKNFYYTQLGILNLIKSFRAYKKLRQEELALKVALKTGAEELTMLADKLDRLLPNIPRKETKKEIEKFEEDKELSLEEELSRIKYKIARLQGEFG